MQLNVAYDRDLVLDTLSSSTKTANTVAFSTKLLTKGYIGPAVKIRNSATGTTQDFYADSSGNLGSQLGAVGTTVETFLAPKTSAVYLANEANVTGNTSAVNYLTSTYTFPSIFSVSFWAYSNTYPSPANWNMLFYTYRTGGGTINSVFVGFYGSSGSYTINCGFAGTIGSTTNFVAQTNTWYHICLVYNSGTLSIYINGVYQTQVSGTIVQNGFILGNNGATGLQTFAGYISDFRIYNRVLSTPEIQYLAGINSTPQAGITNMTVYLPFQSSTSDLSGNAVAITTTGSVSYVGTTLSLPTLGTVDTWYDQSANSSNATQATVGNQPVLLKRITGNYVISFNDAAFQYMNYGLTGTSSIWHNTNYTLIVKELKASNKGNNVFHGTTTQATNQNLITGYNSDTLFSYSQWNNDLNYTVPGFLINDTTNTYSPISTYTTGTPIITTDGPFTTAEGSFGFPGTSGNYISINAAALTSSFQWWTGGGSTMECWVKYMSFTNSASTANNIPALFGSMNATNTTNYWSFGAITTGVLNFYYYNGVSAGANLATTQAISLNTWTHIAMTCDGTNIRIFINGTLAAGPTAISGTPQSGTVGATNFTVGQYTNTNIYNPNVYISNLRIVKGTALYTASFTPSTSPLTAASTGTTLILLRVPTYINRWLVSHHTTDVPGKRMYLNGTQVATRTDNTSLSSPGQANLGRQAINNAWYYNGDLYEFLGFNISLPVSDSTAITTTDKILTVNTPPALSITASAGGSIIAANTIASYGIQMNPSLLATNCIGAYSVGKLIPTYTGPTFQLKRDADNAIADVWIDGDGSVIQLVDTSLDDGSTSGGTITYDGAYRIHTFTSSGTFTVNKPCICDILIVGGGGGAGGNGGGGGGAGGYVFRQNYYVGQTTAVVVGGGGTGVVSPNVASSGTSSSFGSIIAVGGGGSTSRDTSIVGKSGGSGAGGAGSTFNATYAGCVGLVGIPKQGKSGGNSANYPSTDNMLGSTGGGGGGTGSNGDVGLVWYGGNGGLGIANSISGTTTYYCGGGGGGSTDYTGSGSTNALSRGGYGGLGGGGNGSGGRAPIGGNSNGTINTGGGGGGGGTNGGNGGSGIVIVRTLRHPGIQGREAIGTWLGGITVTLPPAALTGYTTVINGQTYNTAGSGQGTNPFWPFDYNVDTPFEAYGYSGANNTYVGPSSTTVNGVSIGGEWCQIQMPVSYILKSYSITPYVDGNYNPKGFVVAGSVDGSTWTTVDSRTMSWSPNSTQNFVTTNINAYTYYRFITTSTIGSGNIKLQEMSLSGTLGNPSDISKVLSSVPGTVIKWYDQSGSSNHVTNIRGNPRVSVYPNDVYLYGSSNDGMRFPSVILPSTYTLFHTAQYQSSGTKQRIFDGASNQWASGFVNGIQGTAVHSTSNLNAAPANGSVVSSIQGWTGTGVGGSAGPLLDRSTAIPHIALNGTGNTVGDYFDYGATTWNVSTNGGITFIGMVKFNNSARNGERIFDFYVTAGTGPNRFLISRATTTNDLRASIGGDTLIYDITITSGIVNGTWQIFAFRLQNMGTNSWQWSAWKDGTKTTAATTTITISDRTTIASQIGRSSYTPSGIDNYADIDIRELLWYNDDLSDAQVTTLYNYLNNKYNTNPAPWMTPPITPYLAFHPYYLIQASPTPFLGSHPADGTAVSYLNGATAYASGGSAGPLLKREGGIPHVTLNGTSTTVGDYFNYGSTTWNLATNGGFTFIGMIRFNGTGSLSSERVFDFGSGQNSNNIVVCRSATSATGIMTSIREGATNNDQTFNIITNGTWQIIAARFQNEGGTTWRPSIWNNGVKTAGTTFTNLTLTDKTVTTSYIGRSQWAVDGYADIDYRECLWFNDDLTDNQITMLYQYLNNKYNNQSIPWYSKSPITPYLQFDVTSYIQDQRIAPNITSLVTTVTSTGTLTATATAATAGGSPGPILNVTDGDPYIALNGSSTTVGDYFSYGSITWNVATNGGFTFIGIIRFNALRDGQRIFDFGSGQANNNVLFCTLTTTTTVRISIFAGATEYASDFTNFITNGSWQIVACRIQNEGTNLWRTSVWNNGVKTAGTQFTATLADRTVTLPYIGKPHWSVNNYSDVDIRELLWYNDDLTDAQIQSLNAYLVRKYSSPSTFLMYETPPITPDLSFDVTTLLKTEPNLVCSVDQNNPDLFRVNGITTASATTTSTNPQLSINYGASGEYSDWIVKDVVVFNNTLATNEIMTVENTLMRKQLGVLDQISSTAGTSCVAAYALYLLTNTYTGPIINVRRSTDNATKDFYANTQGELGDQYMGLGTHIQEWLGSATGYITQWYDQSGRSKHVTQATTNLQPSLVFSKTEGNAVYFNSASLTGANVFDTSTVTDMHAIMVSKEITRVPSVLLSLHGNNDGNPSPRFCCIAPWSDGWWYWDLADISTNRAYSREIITSVGQKTIMSGYKSSADGKSAFRVNSGPRYLSSGNTAGTVSGGIQMAIRTGTSATTYNTNHYIYSIVVFSNKLDSISEQFLENAMNYKIQRNLTSISTVQNLPIPSGLTLYLDANNYSSGTTWYDISGNGYDFTISASAVQTHALGFKYMDFSGAYGSAKRIVSAALTDVPAVANGTFVVFTSILNSTADFRTMTRGAVQATGDHQVMTNTGTNTLGMYDNGGGGFQSAGFDITNLPSPYTQFNMLIFKLSTSSPYYQFTYNNTATYYNITSVNAAFNTGFACIGAYHNASTTITNNTQYWGNISCFLYYNRHLSDQEITEIYNRYKTRYNI